MKKLIINLIKFFGYKVSRINTDLGFPIELHEDEKKIILDSSKYSLTGIARMSALTKCLKNVLKNNIEGDFVECGVWQGGNLILSQKIFNKFSNNKKIYGYDTFSGMSEPTNFDIDYRNKSVKNMLEETKKINKEKNIWAFVNKETVTKNLESELSVHNIKLIEGDVKNTLKNKINLPQKISILRLDTDWYESTKIELEELYPLLQKNGFLIIDDYGHFKGARKAVDEYFEKIGIHPYLHVVDYTCRIFIKNS